MSNGNTFVNVSGEYMYEVDVNNVQVWIYNAGPTKAFRYECAEPGVIALLGADPCDLLSLSEETLESIEFYPNPSSTGIFQIDGINALDQNVLITVVDVYGNVVSQMESTQEIDLSAMANGVYFVTLNFDDEKIVTKKLSLVR